MLIEKPQGQKLRGRPRLKFYMGG